MSSIPSNLVRVPNILSSQMLLASIQHTNQRLLNTQIQLATGRAFSRPSESPFASNAVAVLDDLLERREQRLRNLQHASVLLDHADTPLMEAADLVREARTLGASQIGAGSNPDTRAQQASIIEAMIGQMLRLGNTNYQGLHLFAGSATARAPFAELLGSIHYRGSGPGLLTDTGLDNGVAATAMGIGGTINSFSRVTTPGSTVFGATSARVQGDRDLNPRLTADTRLADLNGARGSGVRPPLGTIKVLMDPSGPGGGTELLVDLSAAHTVGDIASLLQNAIQTVDAAATVTIDPVGGAAFRIATNTMEIQISDQHSPVSGQQSVTAAAADLGLAGTFAVWTGTGGPAEGVGQDVDPKLTPRTPVALLTGVTVPLGAIRVTNAGQTRDLDLSSASTVQDIMNLVHGLNLGIRVEIAATGDRLNFVNELAGPPNKAMSIAEVNAGATGGTATQLGVRSFTATTRLAEFNHGRGVQIKTGSVNPVTNLPDPALDMDFRITLKSGSSFSVDLATAGGGGGLPTTVQEVLDRINAAAVAAGIDPDDFTATLAATGNGITLTDNTTGAAGAVTTLEALNGSFAAEDLGLLPSTPSQPGAPPQIHSWTGASFTGEDRATIAVNGVFANLMALRDALLSNDERGIEFATQRLEADLSRLTAARSDVGIRSRIVRDALGREEDLKIQDTALKSQLQDLDYADAATRFTALQQQLQAAMLTAARTQSMSLLDFLR